ncbi:MAG: hypothetical protein ACI867_002528 [Glaciecola sp.]|jgi:hypothetical protein
MLSRLMTLVFGLLAGFVGGVAFSRRVDRAVRAAPANLAHAAGRAAGNLTTRVQRSLRPARTARALPRREVRADARAKFTVTTARDTLAS